MPGIVNASESWPTRDSFIFNESRTLHRRLNSPMHVLRLTAIVAILFAPGATYPAEQKEILAEATYIMGDGETPAFAEDMVLQKAKQTALEQAGTYVESYTKASNLDITIDEIRTIAGGILQTQVLKKTRTLVGDGIRFDITIKATVSVEQMGELARRIRGRDVTEEYAKLQGEYARLILELETLKQTLPKLSSGSDRESLLNQLREREKSFRTLQAREANLAKRLASGETLYSKAMGQISRKEMERSIVDSLFAKILAEGYVITLGEPQISASLSSPGSVTISVPVSVKVTESIRAAMEDTARMLNGSVVMLRESSRHIHAYLDNVVYRGTAFRIGSDYETFSHFQYRVANQKLVLQVRSQERVSSSCHVAPWLKNSSGLAWSGVYPFGINPAGELNSEDGYANLKSPYSNRGRNDGFVVLVDSSGVNFTLSMTMSIYDAKQLTSLTAEVVDAMSLEERLKRASVLDEFLSRCRANKS